MAVTLNASTSSGFIQTADTSGILTLQNNGTDAVTVTSGNVGIGTSSPDGNLQVYKNAASSLIRVTSSTTGVAGVDFGDTDALDRGQVRYFNNGDYLLFATAAAERARIDSSGNLLVGTTTSQGRLTVQTTTATAGTRMVAFSDSNSRFSGFYEGADGTTFNAANTVLGVRNATGTGRSINASGTVNASGADYAEYMTKAGDFVVAKGDVVGINQQGLITNVFAESVSFVVKSTSPSYVGGDTWGGGFEDDLEALEAARQKVDRIAFAGQVPINVLGAMPGQYIVPVEDNGGISGVAKNEVDLTLAEYIRAVGKVIAIETDGRAKIIVKVA